MTTAAAYYAAAVGVRFYLGSVYLDLNEIDEAVSQFEQALAIFHEIGDRRHEALGHWNLGLAYEAKGKIEEAMAAITVTIEFEKEAMSPELAEHTAYLNKLKRQGKSTGSSHKQKRHRRTGG